MFDSYAGFVARCSAFVFILGCVIVALLVTGHRYATNFSWFEFDTIPEVSWSLIKAQSQYMTNYAIRKCLSDLIYSELT